MLDRAMKLFGATFLLAMIPEAAFALTTGRVPEPESMTLFAVGAAAAFSAYALRKWIKRK